MAKAANTQPTREDLQAQLVALDKQDAIKQRDDEITNLNEQVAKLTRERDTLSGQATELSHVLKSIHGALKPYQYSLEDVSGGGLFRGRPAVPRISVAVTPGEAKMAPTEAPKRRRAKPVAKKLADHFPALSGPEEAGTEE